MQEYLVSISINFPNDVLDAELKLLTEAERVRGKELQSKGVINRIWRIPGTKDNVGIWVAEDPTKLHGFFELLPLFKFMTIKVTSLAIHPLEKE